MEGLVQDIPEDHQEHGVMKVNQPWIMESGEEEGPPALSRVKPLRFPEVFKIAVIRVNHKWMASPLKPVSKFLMGEFDGKKFFIPMSQCCSSEDSFQEEEARQDSSNYRGRSVNFDKGFLWVRMDQEFKVQSSKFIISPEGIFCAA